MIGMLWGIVRGFVPYFINNYCEDNKIKAINNTEYFTIPSVFCSFISKLGIYPRSIFNLFPMESEVYVGVWANYGFEFANASCSSDSIKSLLTAIPVSARKRLSAFGLMSMSEFLTHQYKVDMLP